MRAVSELLKYNTGTTNIQLFNDYLFIKMACTLDYIDFVCSQLNGIGEIRTRKMFGDWCIYIDEKPVVLACDNICYVKKHAAIEDMMSDAECGCPYDGAKEHYILDIEHGDDAKRVVRKLVEVLPYPKKKTKK